MTENESWYKRANLTLGMYGSLYGSLDKITGDSVFGIKRGKTKIAYNLLCDFMDKSEHMECFKIVPKGHIITTPPTQEEMILKLKEYISRAKEYYNNNPFTTVIDLWAGGKIHEGEPLDKTIEYHSRLLERNEKRFKGTLASPSEQIKELITSSDGMLCEGHVIAYLNNTFSCLECKSKGNIGWCDGISHRSVDGFRDATCMKCREKGIITLFEIKTRWESAIKKNKDPGTYTGSFAAINSLLMIKANVYIVIASRDTGNVRIGKITTIKLRGNKNWLYSLQEGNSWGAPSSYVSCQGGLLLLPDRMTPLITVDKMIKNVITVVHDMEIDLNSK